MHLIPGPITSLIKAGKVLRCPQIPGVVALICTLTISLILPLQNRAEHSRSSADMQEKETRQRLREYKWWPTRGDAARQEYAGSEACAACHASEAASQAATSMAHAAERAADNAVLRSNPLMTSQPGTDPSPYQTTIRREAHGSEY